MFHFQWKNTVITFNPFDRLSGYSSSYSFVEITNEHIDKIEEEARKFHEAVQNDIGAELSAESRKMFFGRYTKTPENFRFQMGEKVLLHSIVQFVKDIVIKEGHIFFRSIAAEKDFYENVKEIEIGVYFFDNLSRIKKKLSKLKLNNNLQAKPTRSRKKKAMENSGNELDTMELNGVQIKFLRQVLTSKMETKLNRWIENNPFVSKDKLQTEIAFYGDSEHAISFEELPENESLIVKVIGGKFICECGKVLKCDYYIGRVKVNDPLDTLFVKECRKAVEEEIQDINGYWNISNAEKHLQGHAKSHEKLNTNHITENVAECLQNLRTNPNKHKPKESNANADVDNNHEKHDDSNPTPVPKRAESITIDLDHDDSNPTPVSKRAESIVDDLDQELDFSNDLDDLIIGLSPSNSSNYTQNASTDEAFLRRLDKYFPKQTLINSSIDTLNRARKKVSVNGSSNIKISVDPQSCLQSNITSTLTDEMRTSFSHHISQSKGLSKNNNQKKNKPERAVSSNLNTTSSRYLLQNNVTKQAAKRVCTSEVINIKGKTKV